MSGLYTALGAIVIAGGGYLTGKGPAGGLQPKAKTPPPPPAMPDQSAILQQQQLREARDASLQYGRAATVLTGTGAASSTGDKLGP